MLSVKTLMLFSMILLVGCQSINNMAPMRTASFVDLSKYAGDWYVVGNIPTFIETEAYNAIESYAAPVDGKIATTFTFNKGGFSGPLKTYQPTGFVKEGTGNAVWGMQFIELSISTRTMTYQLSGAQNETTYGSWLGKPIFLMRSTTDSSR
jgi:apolipoprotein D and lipocalin family protein